MSPSLLQPKLTKTSSGAVLLDRDHSILSFNERVLDWASRSDVPVLERLRYLCIVSSNLDEFFEVRAEPHLVANQRQNEKALYSGVFSSAVHCCPHAGGSPVCALQRRRYASS